MQTALFLGGTKGLGLELARRAVKEDWDVTVAGRTADTCPLVLERTARPFVIDLEVPQTVSVWSRLGTNDLIVWSAGIYQEGPFSGLLRKAISRYCYNHLIGPVSLLTEALDHNIQEQRPCHVVIIGSTSAFVSRVDETLYGALKAAKAQLARGLGKELPRDLPGSKVTLANPGGMATPFWDGRDRDISRFMDPAAVADAIWREVREQTVPFREFRVIRQPDRSPRIEDGPQMPE